MLEYSENHLRGLFENSVLVVAHPDDEILWFSSILNQVNRTIICYPALSSDSDLTKARQEILLQHPIKAITCLGLEDTGSFGTADWGDPKVTEYGILLSKGQAPVQRYKSNYRKVIEALSRELDGVKNVFTHNPWGDYGNEEHVQVFRAVNEVRKLHGFSLRVSNYCSNKSAQLMVKSVSDIENDYVSLNTNRDLYHAIKRLYSEKGGWTWYENWECFNREAFLKIGNQQCKLHSAFGWPMNMINLKPERRKRPRLHRWLHTVRSRLPKLVYRWLPQ